MKLLDNLDAKLDGEKKGGQLHEVRVGWTADDAALLLGEGKNSICYSGSGKAGNDGDFEDYGASFAKDDVVAAFVDFTGDSVVFSFSKNGEDQGTAYEVPKSDLAGKALFPTVNSRNVKFEVNFGKTVSGDAKDAWFSLAEGCDFAAYVEEGRERGTARIAERAQCEMIMLIGLPGSGKTTWVNEHVEKNPEKRYNVIGTSALIERMKVCDFQIPIMNYPKELSRSSYHETQQYFSILGQWRTSETALRGEVGRPDPKVHPLPPGLAQARLAEAQELHHRPGKVYEAHDSEILVSFKSGLHTRTLPAEL